VSCWRGSRGTCETTAHTLPPLSDFRVPSAAGISYTRLELLDFLRIVAGKLQNGEPRAFYSIRSIRHHAQCPLSAVRRVVEQLKDEGVLTACWGSQTTLQPNVLNHAVRFCGSIAELVPVDEFKTDPACESLAKRLHDELWRRRYACRMWFYEHEDEQEPEFCDRILAQQPDSIIWLAPTRRLTVFGQRLLNCGVPVTRVIGAMAVADVVRELLS
jgi:hypothetical protein